MVSASNPSSRRIACAAASTDERVRRLRALAGSVMVRGVMRSEVYALCTLGSTRSGYLRNGGSMTNVAVIYYSSTGNVHALATALAEGAADAGAEVRLRRVAELAPPEAIDSNPAWRAHADATVAIPEASHDDLRWADAYAF